MANSEHLTYRDCSEYVLCRCGDESFSRCKFTGRYCDADEAGLECSMWEEEKAEILKEEHIYEVSEQAEEGKQFIYYHFKEGKMDREELVNILINEFDIGVDDTPGRILVEFDRLTTERDALIQDKGKLMVDLGKEMQRSSYAEEVLERICEPMQNVEDWTQTVSSMQGLRAQQSIIVLRDYLNPQQKPKDCEHPHLLRIGEDIGYSDVVICEDCGAQGILRLHLITEEDVQPDISL